MLKTSLLLKLLRCPNCHNIFLEMKGGLKCVNCGSLFKINTSGYLDFVIDNKTRQLHTTSEDYAEIQKQSSRRMFQNYIKPIISREPAIRVIDIGCGVGAGISSLSEYRYDVYGIDLPDLSRYWLQLGNDENKFFCCDASKLPFQDNFFDVVCSLGVIEHIGTKIGHCTLSNNYWISRQKYADEILRVTKPRGRIIISCPNKSFPIDIQHGPRDASSPKSRIRSFIFERFAINIHPFWGKYHLLSYSEVKKLFCDNGGAHFFEPLPLKKYFGLPNYNSKLLNLISKLGIIYTESLSKFKFIRSSILNPYLLVLIRK